MTKQEKIRFEKMESALKVIHTWASYYRDNFYTLQFADHIGNLNDIVQKCLEALGKK